MIIIDDGRWTVAISGGCLKGTLKEICLIEVLLFCSILSMLPLVLIVVILFWY
ncbi:MAG: hypothetical protein M3512_11580 [Bacteroidota bacterium]|nr:hypothetical protein [Bacteroidota bacterium]